MHRKEKNRPSPSYKKKISLAGSILHNSFEFTFLKRTQRMKNTKCFFLFLINFVFLTQIISLYGMEPDEERRDQTLSIPPLGTMEEIRDAGKITEIEENTDTEEITEIEERTDTEEIAEIEEDTHTGENIPPLYSFIEKYIIQQESIPESKGRKVLRLSSPIIAFMLGAASGVPYYEFGEAAAKALVNKTPFIIVYSSTCAVTFAVTSCWAYFSILKSFNVQSNEEKIFLEKKQLPIPARVAAHTIPLLTAIPSAYAAYRYITHKELAILVYMMAYSFETNGFLAFFNKILPQINKILPQKKSKEIPLEEVSLEEGKKEKIIEKYRTVLSQHLLNKTIPAFLRMTKEEISSHQKPSSVEEYLEYLVKLNSLETKAIESPDIWKKGRPKKILAWSLALMPTMNAATNIYFSYKGWVLVFDFVGINNTSVCIPLGCLSAIAYYMLDLKGTASTARSAFDSIYYRIRGSSPPSLESVCYPKLSKVLPVVSIFLGCSIAYLAQFADYDTLTEIVPKGLAISQSVAGAASGFFFTFYTTRSIISEFLEIFGRTFGGKTQKTLAITIENTRRLSDAISRSKNDELNKFIALPGIKDVLSCLNIEESIEREQELQETEEQSDTEHQKRKWCGIM